MLSGYSDDTTLPTGTNGQVLSVDGTTATGLSWITNTPSNPLTTKGDLYIYDSDDARLPLGVTGQILSVDTNETTGLLWIDNTGGGTANTTKGDLTSHNGTIDVRLDSSGVTDGYVLSKNASETTGLEWVAAGGGGDPLTTKGDLFGFDSDAQRLAVGTNGQLLTADSAEATGLKWVAATSNPTTTKGDISTYDTSQQRLAVGTDGFHLVSDSAEATGLKWEASTVGVLATGDTSITTDVITNTLIFKTNGTDHMKIKEWGNVGIGEMYPDAKLHVRQTSASGATEVLKLEQMDVDEPMIVFEGTEGANTTSSISTYTTSAGTTKFIKIQLDVGGGVVDYWIPCYSSITS